MDCKLLCQAENATSGRLSNNYRLSVLIYESESSSEKKTFLDEKKTLSYQVKKYLNVKRKKKTYLNSKFTIKTKKPNKKVFSLLWGTSLSDDRMHNELFKCLVSKLLKAF